MREITADMLHLYGDHLAVRGLAVRTRNKQLAYLRSLLSYAYRVGEIERNTGAEAEPERESGHLAERYLTPEQVRTLINKAETLGHGLAVKLLYYTGCRVGELCALTWTDLKPYADRGQATFTKTKTGQPRTVNIPPKLWRELQAKRGEGRVITAHAATVWRWVKAAGVAAGLPNISPHWMRHAHAFHTIESKAPLNTIQATLGHKSLATLAKYMHARPEDSSGLYLEEI